MAMTVDNVGHWLAFRPAGVAGSPATYTLGGGASTIYGAVSDGDDSTYVQTQAPNASRLFWTGCGAISGVPAGARIIHARAIGRVYVTPSRSQRAWNIQLMTQDSNGDWQPTGPRASHVAPVGLAKTGQFGSKASTRDVERKIFANGTEVGVIWGQSPTANTLQGVGESGIFMRTTDVWVEISYDNPPTCTITTPGTITATDCPRIKWDYEDDLQPQSHYRMTIKKASTGEVIYDTGKVASRKTYHDVPEKYALPNDTYKVHVQVWQQWPTADFSSDAVEQDMTINVTPPSAPTLTTSVNNNIGAVTLGISASSLIASSNPFAAVNISYDGGVTWTEQDVVPMTDGNGNLLPQPVNFTDYRLPSGATLNYRVRIWESVPNNIHGPWSTTTAELDFTGVIINEEGPLGAGSAHHFAYNGGGGGLSVTQTSASIELPNRRTPFYEFSPLQAKTYQCSLQVVDQADIDALTEFATFQGLIRIRDGRGVNIVGIMGQVSINYWSEGDGWDVSFTLTESTADGS